MLDKGVFRISFYIGNMDQPAFKKGSAYPRPAFGFYWRIAYVVHELTREAKSLGAIENAIFSRVIIVLSASQSRAADSTRVCNTACRSKVERLMVLRTFAVAVCC